MKLGDLIKKSGYIIESDLDYNLMQFILNLDLKVDIVKTENIEVKCNKRKYNKTFLDKLCKYKKGDPERDFILNILENNSKYSSYKYTYLEWVNFNIKDYTKEIIQSLSDVSDIDIYEITDGEVSEYDIINGIEDINKMIDVFKEKVLPPVELDAVYEEFSDIFEKIVGEKSGFLRDRVGKWHKFGQDSYRDAELLGIKYPSLGEAMQDEELMECFVNYLMYGTDEYLYNYNEKEIINGWY